MTEKSLSGLLQSELWGDLTAYARGVEMSETVLAKDAKAGEWYRCENGDRVLCLEGNTVWDREDGVCDLSEEHQLEHLPDCTGWDWEPPKPKSRYRPFLGSDEFLSHLEGVCPVDWFYRRKTVKDQFCSIIGFNNNTFDGMTWVKALEELEWCTGKPFGVEVSE
jgi:hypothetical protein